MIFKYFRMRTRAKIASASALRTQIAEGERNSCPASCSASGPRSLLFALFIQPSNCSSLLVVKGLFAFFFLKFFYKKKKCIFLCITPLTLFLRCYLLFRLIINDTISFVQLFTQTLQMKPKLLNNYNLVLKYKRTPEQIERSWKSRLEKLDRKRNQEVI